jgi:hypothetical protein
MAHLFDSLQSGAPFRTSVADGLAAQESAKSGKPVSW